MRILRQTALASVAGAILLATAAVPAWAQAQGSIRGTVTDAVTLRPLAGVQVYVAGSTIGTLTNPQGEYLILNVPLGAATVQTSMIGYEQAEAPVTVAAGEPAVADFELAQSAVALDEIVVTGTAGGAQRRSIGNSVTQIQAAQVTQNIPVTDAQELLTARTPSVTMFSSSGQAGASSRIRIRGASSLEGGNEPVIFVDGIRVVSGSRGGTSLMQDVNPLDAINPNDIASIEVIKGPAAATLYGAEAAGGVIQILTKKGQAGSGDVQWAAGVEMGQVEWTENIPTTYTLCDEEKIADEEEWPGCTGEAPGTVLSDQPLLNEYTCQFTTECFPNALRTGDQLGFDLSARGGGENYSFYLSGERSDQEGVYYNNSAERTSGRANLGFTPSENLNFSVNLAYARRQVQVPLSNNASNSVLRNAYRGRPGWASPWAPGFRGFSPEISNQFDFHHESERTMIGLTANYNPVDWLENRLTIGLDNNERLAVEFERIDETGQEPWGATAATGTIERELNERHYWTVDYAGSIVTDFGEDYSSDLSVGMQLSRRQFHQYTVDGEGLVANKLNLVGAAAVTTADEDFEEQTSLGFYVQETVGWQNRLFGTVALRVDDNSAFGNDFELVYYPKVQFSYVISEAPFFEVPHVDELRLRAAWGQAGNAPDPFSADRTYQPGVTTFVDDEGSEVAVNRIGTDAFGNPDLKAETGSEIEVGFDSGLFGGRVGFDFTYYRTDTYDALVEVPDAPSTGFTEDHLINVGHILNSGFEVMLTGTPVYTPSVVWDASLAFSTNSNELVSFGGAREVITFGSFADVQKHVEGYPLGGYWAVDVQRNPDGSPILDEDGLAVVDLDDDYFVGPMLPTRQVGLSNTVTLFGNLRLYANLDYRGGNYQWCAICSINNRIDQNTWEVNNPDASPEQIAVWTSLQTKTHIFKADFVKLRELSATYSLPASWAQAFRASGASLTLSGRNLWMWTEYGGPNDPEVAFDSGSDFGATDYASTPMMRSLAASLRVTF